MNINCQTLAKLMICCGLALLPMSILAAEESTNSVLDDTDIPAYIEGRWQGVLQGEFRSQGVAWRFLTTETGELRGFMGAVLAGYPDVAMEDLRVDSEGIRFEIPAQNARFHGAFTPEGVTGIWTQGISLPLVMRRRVFAFPVPAALRADLLGTWETRIIGTPVILNFEEETEDAVAGYLSLPTMEFDRVPMVELLSAPGGQVNFAADNGRRFIGRLVNGVLLGTYTVAGATYYVRFEKPGRAERPFTLDLNTRAQDSMLGYWQGSVAGTSVSFNFEANSDGAVQGTLLISGRSPVPVLEVVQQADAVAITSLNGRYFNGELADDVMTGTYSYERVTYNATFTRQSPDEVTP